MHRRRFLGFGIAVFLAALVLTLSLVLPRPAAHAMEQNPAHTGLAPPLSTHLSLEFRQRPDYQTQSTMLAITANVWLVSQRGNLDATSAVPRASVFVSMSSDPGRIAYLTLLSDTSLVLRRPSAGLATVGLDGTGWSAITGPSLTSATEVSSLAHQVLGSANLANTDTVPGSLPSDSTLGQPTTPAASAATSTTIADFGWTLGVTVVAIALLLDQSTATIRGGSSRRRSFMAQMIGRVTTRAVIAVGGARAATRRR